MRTAWLVLISFAVFTLVAYLGFHFAPAPVTTVNPSPQANAGNTGSERIVLAHDPPELPPGPGKTQFATYCVVCHSARYVTIQPRFSRKVWKAEVQKMVTVYKAAIGERDQAQIVNYLVASFGVEDGNK
ncbi:MAG: hypothetical protein ACLQVN_04680 [Bryobacteraceae bacterium]